MSDCIKRFIPDNPNYRLSKNTINVIQSFNWYGDNVVIEVNDIIKFADSGSNFESVSCPFCKFDLMNWWGNAMNKAYSDENGFTNLEIITPCCGKATTLHDLNYNFPQGFYKTIIEIQVFDDNSIDTKNICNQLFITTNENWRVINTHY